MVLCGEVPKSQVLQPPQPTMIGLVDFKWGGAPPTSEERTIPGVTCQALYSPLFMDNFHHFLNLSTFLFMYLHRNCMTFKFVYAILVLTIISILKIILQVLNHI